MNSFVILKKNKRKFIRKLYERIDEGNDILRQLECRQLNTLKLEETFKKWKSDNSEFLERNIIDKRRRISFFATISTVPRARVLGASQSEIQRHLFEQRVRHLKDGIEEELGKIRTICNEIEKGEYYRSYRAFLEKIKVKIMAWDIKYWITILISVIGIVVSIILSDCSN